MFQTLIYSILLIIIAIFFYLFYITVIGSWIEGKMIERKHGKNIKLIWFPGAGVFMALKKSGEKYKDQFKVFDIIRKEQPETKAVYSAGIKRLPLWFVFEPSLQKQILQNIQYYEKCDSIAFNQNKFFGQGMFFAEGQSWKKQRNMIADSFHFQSLKSYTPFINTITRDQIKQIKVGEVDNVINTCSIIAGKVVAATFFGEDFNNIQINGRSIIEELQDVGNLVGERARQPSFLIKFGLLKGLSTHPLFMNSWEKKMTKRMENLQEFFYKYIEEKIEENRQNQEENKQENFLKILLAEYEKKQLTIHQIFENFFSFFFAGIDTTGNFAGMSFYGFAKYPKVQKRVHDDILAYFKETRENFDPTQDFEIYHEDLNKIETLNNFIKESFRFYNPGSGTLIRKVVKDHKLGDFDIKKGQLITIQTRINTKTERFFKNPDEFDIDRWNRPETKNIDPFAYIPFSAGPRNCLGQHLALIEVKVMIIKFLLKFRMETYKDNEIYFAVKLVFATFVEDLVVFQSRY